MSRIDVELFEKPIRKRPDELELGVDVVELEYGDYGNYVKVVVEYCGLEGDGRWWRTAGKYVSNGCEFDGYSTVYKNKIIDYKVVGKVVKNEIN
jgi:hypothetical protein